MVKLSFRLLTNKEKFKKYEKGGSFNESMSKMSNKESGIKRFCKKCGFQLSGSSFQDKKEKVLGEKKKETLIGSRFPLP